MGIQGLLPFLKKVSRPVNIKEFRGCTVAIDSYCWLHRGAFACAEKLATGQKTDQYVFYCMKYINNLLSFGIKPVMVFDGCHLPSKKKVEKARRERREMNRKKAAQLLREGKRSEAREALVQCVDITSQMALELMNACRDKGVDCIVAPYEADSQLAYLNKIGVAQVIITEDSDLLLFGCERVMFKMDISGNGMLIRRQDLCDAMNLRPDVYTFDKFRYMCILSGCDYLANLPGIGLGKSNKVFQMSRQNDMRLLLRKLPSTLNMNNLTVPTEYIEGFQRANNTFLYQLVYDPLQKKVVPLNSYPPELDQSELHYAGPAIPAPKAYQIALGNMDVNTGQIIADYNPLTHKPKSQTWDDSTKKMPHMLSIWNPNYRVKRIDFNSDPRDVERPLTKGKEVKVALPKACKRPSPLKRIRLDEEEEVEDDVLLQEVNNAELASMYCPEVTDPPPSKRSRSNLREGMEPLTSAVSQLESQEREEVKENLAVSCRTPKNKFALATGSAHKNKFCLNASKTKTEVKSRFFASGKPLHKTAFFGELEKGLGVTKVETPVQTKVSPSSSPLSPQSQSPDSQSKTTNSNSPYQSFGFAKLKNPSADSSPKHMRNSSAVASQFKPVKAPCDRVCEQNDSESAAADDGSDYSTDTLGGSTDTLGGSTNTLNDSPVALPSSLYSIDSSLTSSQTSDVTTSWGSQSSTGHSPLPRTSRSQTDLNRTSAASRLSLFANKKQSGSFTYPATSKSEEVCDLTTDETPDSGSVAQTMSQPTVSSSKLNQKSCRSVGLSKTSPKNKSSKRSAKKPEQSTTMHNFFNKFSYSAKKRASVNEEPVPDLPTLE